MQPSWAQQLLARPRNGQLPLSVSRTAWTTGKHHLQVANIWLCSLRLVSMEGQDVLVVKPSSQQVTELTSTLELSFNRQQPQNLRLP